MSAVFIPKMNGRNPKLLDAVVDSQTWLNVTAEMVLCLEAYCPSPCVRTHFHDR